MLGFLKHIAKMQSISITHHHHPLPCLGISRDWMMGGAGSHGVVRAATTPLLDGWLDAWLDGWMDGAFFIGLYRFSIGFYSFSRFL